MDGQDKPGHDALGNGTAKRSFMGVALGDLDPAAPVCVRRRGHVGLGEWQGGHCVEGWAAPVRCLGFLGGFGSWRWNAVLVAAPQFNAEAQWRKDAKATAKIK